MYAFGNRPDFTAMDEPFYAAYLAQSGINHPMKSEILAAYETDPNRVARACLDDGEKPHKYLKLMPHHMLDGFPIDWAQGCINIHLIRHPARVIASYAAKREIASLQDIGFPRQAALFDLIGGIVVDSFDIRQDPENTLENLCLQIGLSFDPAMLHWPAGPKPFDGIWASHWYNAVHQSTEFAGPEGPMPDLKGAAADLLDAALPFYERMKSFQLVT
jgi:hypothetical protein